MAFMGLGLGGSSSLLLSGDRLPRRMIFSTLTSGVFSSTNIAATAVDHCLFYRLEFLLQIQRYHV